MKGRFAIGVDLGGTGIKAGLVDLGGEKPVILIKKSVPTNAPRPASDICRDICGLCRDICLEAGIGIGDLEKIGVGSPGSVSDGVVHSAGNLGFSEVPLRRMISEMTDGMVSVTLANDANAAAYGEYVECGGKGSLVAITLGTGVGGGIIIDGKVIEGHNGAAGEIGHIIINGSNGRRCSCGCRGCLEAHCSATALIAITKETAEAFPGGALAELVSNEGVSGKTAFRAARLGDPAAERIVENYINDLASGVASVIQMLQPETVCIGGGISREGEPLIAPLRKKVYEMVYPDADIKKTEIRAAALGNDAGIIGAACIPC